MTATTDDVTKKAREIGQTPAFNGEYNKGLSTREYIATACLQGMLADPEFIQSADDAARTAVSFADALLAELAK